MAEYRRPYDVDILVRGYGHLGLTRRCLRSIIGNTQEVSYRITYVDNGSRTAPDGESPVGLVADFPVVQFVLLPFNHGSVRGINAGLALARLGEAPYILLLDNDTEIPQGDYFWLKRLIGYMTDSHVGAAGCVTNYVVGGQHTEVVSDRLLKDKPLEAPVLVSFALLLRRAAADSLAAGGYFDERYEPGNSEDYDYILQLRDAGWKAVVADSVWVHHRGSQTFGSMNFAEILRLNSTKLAEKWGTERLAEMGLEICQDQP